MHKKSRDFLIIVLNVQVLYLIKFIIIRFKNYNVLACEACLVIKRGYSLIGKTSILHIVNLGSTPAVSNVKLSVYFSSLVIAKCMFYFVCSLKHKCYASHPTFFSIFLIFFLFSSSFSSI